MHPHHPSPQAKLLDPEHLSQERHDPLVLSMENPNPRHKAGCTWAGSYSCPRNEYDETEREKPWSINMPKFLEECCGVSKVYRYQGLVFYLR